MIAPPKPPAQDDAELLIKEARERQLRRRLLGAAGVAITAAVALAVYAVTIGDPSGGGPAPTRAGGAAAPLCRSSQLAGSASFQGATQTMLGGITLRNTSGVACSLPTTRPAVRMSWEGQWLPTRETPMPSPGASFTPARVLAPGAKASVFFQWWSCGGPGPRAAVRPGFQLTFGHGLVVVASSAVATPSFCGGLSGTRNLAVSRPQIES
jgi:Protein of unknown function (DUF4232)